MDALTYWFASIADQGAAAMLMWSWQALALLALVWISLKICRLKSPALRHQVWLFGLIAVAALPLSSMVVRRFPSLQPANSALNYVLEAPRVVIDFESQAPIQTLPEAAPEAASAVSPSTSSVKATAKIPIVRPLLFAIWAIGALVTLARLMKNRLSFQRALRRSQSIHSADLDCGESITLMTGQVGLRLSSEIHSPILCGLFRPIILLPADIIEWTTPDERAAMLRHELAHIERRDMLVNFFQTALSVIFYFHPAVRYACRQLSLEREMACDDRVVELGAAEVYASSILKAAERRISAVGAPSGAYQLEIFSSRQILERRIEMILNAERARMTAHQWRYLILPVALIAVAAFLLIPRYSAQNLSSHLPVKDSLKPGKGPSVKASYSREEQELIEMIQQVAALIPQQWPGLYFKSGLPDKRLLFDDFRLHDRRNALTIIPPRPPQLSGSIILTKVEVGDFEVNINNNLAVIDFIGAIHLGFPDQGEASLITDSYRVSLVKANGQWQADRRTNAPWVRAIFWPPGPPAPPDDLRGAWAEAQRATLGLNIVNNGDAEFSITAQPPSTLDDSQSAWGVIGELEHRYCRCSAQAVQNAVMKIGELELRSEQGIRFSHAERGVQMRDQNGLRIFAIDAIHLKDRFELQWGEQTYYGLGSVTANYHQEKRRLDIGGFPETRLYRTPDRTGEAITLQQLAQELKDQALRRN